MRRYILDIIIISVKTLPHSHQFSTHTLNQVLMNMHSWCLVHLHKPCGGRA